MTASEFKVHIEKLVGKKNWEFWKGNVQLLLEFHGLFGAVDGTEKCPDCKDEGAVIAEAVPWLELFRKKDTHANLIITTNIARDMRRQLGVVETAKDMWDNTEFFSARKDANVSYLEYIATLQRALHQLCEEAKKQFGFEIPEKVLLLRITSTIPPRHKTVQQVWDATRSSQLKKAIRIPLQDSLHWCLQVSSAPRMDHLRVFGTKTFVYVPKQQRQKWNQKSNKGLLVGYESFDGYRIYVPSQRKVVRSCHVQFVKEKLLQAERNLELIKGDRLNAEEEEGVEVNMELPDAGIANAPAEEADKDADQNAEKVAVGVEIRNLQNRTAKTSSSLWRLPIYGGL
uniref:Retroviral polymerase SH3-like domain-containing protein n=1 Tax=Trichuris muris TaxID=70415 RepID=A0A5S6QAU0_TRIMR